MLLHLEGVGRLQPLIVDMVRSHFVIVSSLLDPMTKKDKYATVLQHIGK